MYNIIVLIISWIIIVIIGIGVGVAGNIKKGELEQKLCQLKKYEYCTKKNY